MVIPGFSLIQQIYEGLHSLVYRGIRDADKKAVVIKILKDEYPSAELLARFKREYELLNSLQEDGTVAAYGIEPYRNGLVITMEEFGSSSLKQLLAEHRLSMDEFLKIALAITETLEKIHSHQIVHKDINPANILWDAKGQQIKIIDFGISSTLPREEPELQNLQVIEGMLPYISPEQTGRMNRGIDYRTDYYSLGVVFYEMATGQLPFQSQDALELVHAHIAKLPPNPHEVDNNVPEAVAAIILKLMAKTAEERYQSTFGLKADLQHCLTQWQSHAQIVPFSLGKQDISSRFSIAGKLYGREAERQLLLDAFSRVNTGNSELTLVTGYAGVGKSRLIHEIRKPVAESHGYFIAGKFDQFKRNVPYASIVQALQEWVQQILTQNDAVIHTWRERILNALGSNAQVIVEVIPNLTAIIGPQPPLPELGAVESQNRFNLAFKHFIQTLADKEHPLVIFLDDLQWADNPSLSLLETLLGNLDSRYLLVIGAYRDNEIDATHPLVLTLEALKKDTRITNINLQPLRLEHVKDLLIDTLHRDTAAIQPLADISYSKTHGNPFFLTQFLQQLYHSGLIEFDLKKGHWQWDIAGIQHKEFTDNVVEFMADKVRQLAPQTQQILKIAACLGNRFDIQTLAIIEQRTTQQIAKDLWQALEEGLVLPIDDAYKYVAQLSTKNATYQFLHDRVQQAAYSLIPEQERNTLHLTVGRLLLKNTPEEELVEKALPIANHLNAGISQLNDPAEKLAIAKLNLIAGQKSKASVAYQPALNYLQMGIALLTDDSWKNHYDLTLALYTEAVEAAYLANVFDVMSELAQIVFQHGNNALDAIKTYEVKLAYFSSQHQFEEAIDLGIKALKLFGIILPKQPSKGKLILALLRTKWLLRGKSIDDLYHLPPMTDAHWQAAMRILSAVIAPTYLANQQLFLLMTLKVVELTVKYGVTPQSALGYTAYAVILCTVLNDVEKGYQYGRLALQLVDQLQADRQKTQVYFTFYAGVAFWHDHLRQDLAAYVSTFQKGLEMGDLEYAGLSAMNYIAKLLFSGTELPKVAEESKKYAHSLLNTGQKTAYLYVLNWWRLALQLLHYNSQEMADQGAALDEKLMIAVSTQKKDNGWFYSFYLHKIVYNYLLDKPMRAYKYLPQATLATDQVMGTFWKITFYFYAGLLCLTCYTLVPKKQQKELLQRVQGYLKKLKKWSRHSPINFLHKYYLIAAEYARVLHKYNEAEKYYEQAIAAARENNYLQEEAIANELTAKFYLSQKKEKVARAYLNDAYYGYTLWGATAKTQQLEEKYEHLLFRETQGISLTQTTAFSTQTTTSGTAKGALDLATIMKSAQTISKEIVLADLLRKMMHIVIENAGAQKGCLLLEKDGQWFIEAEGVVDSEPQVLQSVPIEGMLPTSIVSYVLRSKEPIVVNNVAKDEQFSTDPYIVSIKPKSLLCLPLLNQGALSGILYLENNLTAHAFTQERLDLLNLLSGQLVISMDNAKLYTNLADLNIAYARFVPKEFLALLEKNSITNVEVGDQTQKDMTILFLDIRDFTALSESMTPQQNFTFINEFLSYMEPVIAMHDGFVDKYLGDGIMALFPTNADAALQSAIALLLTLDNYNEVRLQTGESAIKIGIGLNSGLLMLGTVGGAHRMDGTVISDAVNLASRVEALTKTYSAPLLITQETYSRLKDPGRYAIRRLGVVMIRGKSKPITIYEVFDADPISVRDLKQQTIADFEKAITLYQHNEFTAALEIFNHILELNEYDTAAKSYRRECKKKL